LAKSLKPDLERVNGFIDNERFGSKRTEGRVLSLSTWRDEKAVIRWRTLGIHHEVQEKGRFEVFEDYHLRVGEIVADNEIPRGQKLHELGFDETALRRCGSSIMLCGRPRCRLACLGQTHLDMASLGPDFRSAKE
jgi:heme-degrading monooxygenase HmoA